MLHVEGVWKFVVGHSGSSEGLFLLMGGSLKGAGFFGGSVVVGPEVEVVDAVVGTLRFVECGSAVVVGL